MYIMLNYVSVNKINNECEYLAT